MIANRSHLMAQIERTAEKNHSPTKNRNAVDLAGFGPVLVQIGNDSQS